MFSSFEQACRPDGKSDENSDEGSDPDIFRKVIDNHDDWLGTDLVIPICTLKAGGLKSNFE